MHICGREENILALGRLGFQREQAGPKCPGEIWSGVTPAQVILAWSQHQPCLQEGSQGSSEPTAHPAACESLRDIKLPGSHTLRGLRWVHRQKPTSPQPAKEPKHHFKWLQQHGLSWASGGKACVQAGIALHCCDRGKHSYSTAAAELGHYQYPVAFQALLSGLPLGSLG